MWNKGAYREKLSTAGALTVRRTEWHRRSASTFLLQGQLHPRLSGVRRGLVVGRGVSPVYSNGSRGDEPMVHWWMTMVMTRRSARPHRGQAWTGPVQEAGRTGASPSPGAFGCRLKDALVVHRQHRPGQFLAGKNAPDADGQVVIDLDGVLVIADKEGAAPTWKKTYSHHPLTAFLDHGPGGTGEPVAALLRPGNAKVGAGHDELVAALAVEVERAGPAVDYGLEGAEGALGRRAASGEAFSRRAEKKLKKAQRDLSRKQKGSRNREKARLKVARAHAQVADARSEFHHQLATKLIRENQAIGVEDLAVNGLARSRPAESVHDAGWAQFVAMLECKAARYGRDFVKIDRFEPTSRTCSACGAKDGPKPLHIREWTCAECDAVHDRDHNAATNVKTAAGLAVTACEAQVGPGLVPAQLGAAGSHGFSPEPRAA